MMWLWGVKTLLLLYLVQVHAYHDKVNYINSKRDKLLSNYNKYYNSASVSGTTPNPWLNRRHKATAVNYNNNNNSVQVKLRHHSTHSGAAAAARFPNLDGVMSRLNNFKTTTTTSTHRPLWVSYQSNQRKGHYAATADDNEDFDYDDEEFDDELSKVDNDDDDAQDYDTWDNEDEAKSSDENYDDIDGEEEDFSNIGNGWQAEEGTEAPSGVLTEYKWRHYGTRPRVEESRRKQVQITGGQDYALAMEHMRRMVIEAKCKTPVKKVVNPHSEHPSPGKRYIPHCTTLYRCAEDTGCCNDGGKKCLPKKQQLVYLHFYTTSLGKPGTLMEKLPFYNHTECDCLLVGSVPEEVHSSAPENLRATRSGPSIHSQEHLVPKRCNCPEEFTSKVRYDSRCICDCSEANVDCLHIKKGNEHLSLRDRKCITDKKCGTPTCEYGAYMRIYGRCPRKEEKIDFYASSSMNSRNMN